MCVIDGFNFLFALIYAVLGFICFKQILIHWPSFQQNKAVSLKVYLICTFLFCALRALDFTLVPFTNPCGGKEWQWELLGDSSSVMAIIISTLPSALFFTSYTSFAYSLSRIYDLLTNQSSRYSLRTVLGVLNICIYFSLIMYYFSIILTSDSSSSSNDDANTSTITKDEEEESSFDRLAQLTIALSALITAGGMLFYGYRTSKELSQIEGNGSSSSSSQQQQGGNLSSFFYQSYSAASRTDSASDRVGHVKKIISISLICTFCFAIRALLLILSIKLNAYVILLYFFVIEVFPTAFMILLFHAKGSPSSSSSSSSQPGSNNQKNKGWAPLGSKRTYGYDYSSMLHDNNSNEGGYQTSRQTSEKSFDMTTSSGAYGSYGSNQDVHQTISYQEALGDTLKRGTSKKGSKKRGKSKKGSHKSQGSNSTDRYFYQGIDLSDLGSSGEGKDQTQSHDGLGSENVYYSNAREEEEGLLLYSSGTEDEDPSTLEDDILEL